MSAISQQQQNVITRYGWDDCDLIDGGIVVCEVSHPAGSVDVYVELDGSIYVEEGDDLDGFEMVPLEDSFLAGLDNG